MKTRNYLLVVPFLLGVLQSCQKDTQKKSAKNSSLIIGKWMSYQRHTRVFDAIDNSLLKDTTITFSATNNVNPLWYETYNSDGAAYVISRPYTVGGKQRVDTTAFMHYSIEGSHLTLKPNGGGSETKPIIELTETNMNLESTYTGLPRLGWGLNAETTYKFTDEVLYKKQ